MHCSKMPLTAFLREARSRCTRVYGALPSLLLAAGSAGVVCAPIQRSKYATHALSGGPTDAILRVAQEVAADPIVAGNKWTRAQVAFSEVSERHCSPSTLCFPDRDDLTPPAVLYHAL
jgi:hypothetical protein